MTPRPRRFSWLLLAVAGLALTGCGSDDGIAAPTQQAAAWPRTITHAAGRTVIPAAPQRVVSASVGLTGTLLAIKASVVASASNAGGEAAGFPDGWASTARQRGVDALPAAGGQPIDPAAVAAVKPDLIVLERPAAAGSAAQYQAMTSIAPTVVVDPADPWTELAVELATATGHEDDARRVVADFTADTVAAARKIRPPQGTVSVVAYHGRRNSAVGKAAGPHATLLRSLGFRVAPAPVGLDSSLQRSPDFSWVSQPNLPKAITGRSVLLLTARPSDVQRFRKDPAMASVPAVRSSAVFPLGSSATRLDYYSSTQLVDHLVEQFG